MYARTGYTGLLVVLFLMGAQSAFFGPSKYGILPELFRGTDLPRANGIVIMTTFLAIIFGTATAGVLGDLLVEHLPEGGVNAKGLWIGSLACIGIAILGTITSVVIRHTPRAVPNLKFRLSSLAIPPETRAVLWNDKPLLAAIFASSMFWLVSGVTVLVVNYVGLNEMNLPADRSKTLTSLLNACTGLGIALGAVLAGKLSAGKADFRLTRLGAWGIVACLCLLGLYNAAGNQLLGFNLSMPLMILLGMFAAFFAIPVQVFIQARPQEDQKGRVIAVMNQANFTAILLSGAIYGVFDRTVNALSIPHAPIFMMTALIILPVAIFYHPKNVELKS
jgi:acyl-[acyl-carrier-protein]-phospholipid O-acyltransferase/long-chain-fatty-acid--[acyl-carrier-protein] ligase